MGAFAYYARRIKNLSKRFLSKDALKPSKDIQAELAKVRFGAIRDNVPFEVESDA